MTSRQMKRGSSAPQRQSNVRQSNYKRGVGGRIDAVYQLMLLQGVFRKVNFFKLSACQIGSILVRCRVVIARRRAIGWVTKRLDKRPLVIMRDLMAYRDDKIIKAQSPVLFSALHCSAFFFIIIPIILHQLSHHYYKNLQTKRGHPLLIIQTMCNAALRQLNAVQLKSQTA